MSLADVNEQIARRTAHGAVTQDGVDADIAAATLGLYDDRGNFDASGNTFPAAGGSGAAGAIAKGDIWTVSVAGTLDETDVLPGDTVRALINAPGSTPANWAINAGSGEVASEVKAYRAILNQTGTAAPVPTVIENTLGGAVVWAYEGPGIYSGTLSGAFPANKVFATIGDSPFGNVVKTLVYRANDNSLEVSTADASSEGVNGGLFNVPIEILVYP